jgi:hypothetical protein
MLERERWDIDESRSTLTFALRHFVVGEIRGTFGRWGGTLLLDPADLGRSSLQVWIDLASVDTGSAERDAHLRSQSSSRSRASRAPSSAARASRYAWTATRSFRVAWISTV